MYYFTYINIFIIKKDCSESIKFKHHSMDDAESKNLEKNIFRQLVNHIYDGRSFYKSFWVRHCSVFFNTINRKFRLG
jgi:hypothetical protein